MSGRPRAGEPRAPHPHLRVERSPAGYRLLLLSRPQRHNALDVDLARALRDALAEYPPEPVVLGSTDPQLFCAGADLTVSDADRARVSDLFYECCETVITRPGPVIAAVGGPAVGGGAQLAAAADVRIAGPAARLRWTGPPRMGLAVGAWILPDLVGRGRALDLIMTARWVDATEALSHGLVSEVVAEPLAAAAGLAGDLAARGPGPLARAKLIMAAGGLLERLHAEQRANQAAWAQALAGGGYSAVAP
jgi:enoyl-CoA hydratase/carnithine racemase